MISEWQQKNIISISGEVLIVCAQLQDEWLQHTKLSDPFESEETMTLFLNYIADVSDKNAVGDNEQITVIRKKTIYIAATSLMVATVINAAIMHGYGVQKVEVQP